MTGNKGYIQNIVLSLLLFSVSGFFLLAGSGQDELSLNDSGTVQKKIMILKKISSTYKHDLEQLGKSKEKIRRLQDKAERSIISNVSVVMFKGMAGIIYKYFNTPGPEGPLQELLQEMLFETETTLEEGELIRSWMKRNFLRRKKLRKTYKLLEQVLLAPLNRFDNEKESFPYTEELWKEPDGNSDPYLKRVKRRLNVIVYISRELSGQIDKEMGELGKERSEVENEILRLRSENKSPEAEETGETDNS